MAGLIMADFKPAFDKTIGHEIGYVNNPNDAGGETYNGISRRFHPDWEGWKFIDKAKNSIDFPKNIPNEALKYPVAKFYKHEFWDKVKGDDIPDQDLGEWLFDIAVNGGPKRAGRYLQKALNLLNRDQRDYADITVDGKIGKKTIATIRKYLAKRDRFALLLFVGCQMVTHWMNRAEKVKGQEEFLNGIGNRWVSNVQSVADKYYLNAV